MDNKVLSLFFRSLIFLCLWFPFEGASQSTGVLKFNRTFVASDNSQACYQLEIKSGSPDSFVLSDQNYRIFFDGDLMTIDSVTSLLPSSHYSAVTIDQNLKFTGLGQEAFSPLDKIDDHLGFLDFTIIHQDKSDLPGSVSVTPDEYVEVAEICISIDTNVYAAGDRIYLYHSRPSTAGSFTTQYTTIAENNAPGNTVTVPELIFNDLICDRLTSSTISVFLRAKLQGAMLNTSNTLMRDDLRMAGLIPSEEPYSDLSCFAHVGGGYECIDTAMLAVAGADAVVDWVFLELRDSTDEDSIVATRSALLQRDGDIVNADGTAPVVFDDLSPGNYYVVVRHRNHLSVMTDSLFWIDSLASDTVDFTDLNLKTRGAHAQFVTETETSLWCGDVDGNGSAIYQGPGNDVVNIFNIVINDPENVTEISNYISHTYHRADVDLDGRVIYQGPGNDNSLLLFNSVLRHPNNTMKLSNFINNTQITVFCQ